MDRLHPSPLVCFAHGRESGPWGTKITHLSGIAHDRGFEVLSPDYRFTFDPQERLHHLLSLAPKGRPLVLVGSSMGGYVSAFAASALSADALFLMAPALYMPGYEGEPQACPGHTVVVHGWDDDIVPVDNALRYARRHRAQTHVLASGHTLNDQLPTLGLLFADCLERARSPDAGSA